MIENIKKVLTSFSKVEIGIVSRVQNKLAHQIAATAKMLGDHMVMAGVHLNVRQQMIDECTITIA